MTFTGLSLLSTCRSHKLISYLCIVITNSRVTMTVLLSHLKRLTVIFTTTVDTNHFTKLELFSCQAEVFQLEEENPFPFPVSFYEINICLFMLYFLKRHHWYLHDISKVFITGSFQKKSLDYTSFTYVFYSHLKFQLKYGWFSEKANANLPRSRTK